MLEYILKILRDAPNTHLHNALYNMLNDSTFRENITYNPKSDKFEIPCSKINAHTDEVTCQGFVRADRITMFFRNLWKKISG